MDFPKSVPSVGLVDGKFVDEDVVAGTPGSLIPAQWGNAVTEELLNVIESAGLTPDEDNNAQLLAAINAKIAAAIPSAPPDASTTVKGLVELATDAETQAGADAVRAVTPATLAACTATVTRAGVIEIATVAETQAGADTARAVTPAGLASTTATVSRAGLVELATNTETQDGTDTQRAVTPASLSARVGTESQSGILQLATQAEAIAGTESSKAMSAIRVAQAIASRLAAEYSAQYTISPGSIFSISHSKGIDASIEFVFVCLVADAGYSPGEECETKDWRYSPLNSAQNYGVFITSRTANSFNMVMASGTTWFIPHKTTAASTSIVVARWAVKARIKS